MTPDPCTKPGTGHIGASKQRSADRHYQPNSAPHMSAWPTGELVVVEVLNTSHVQSGLPDAATLREQYCGTSIV